MLQNEYLTKIRIREDTSANWREANPILASSEPAREIDTGYIKYGDGKTAWNDLEYYQSSGANVAVDDLTISKDEDLKLQSIGLTNGQKEYITYEQVHNGILPYTRLNQLSTYLYEIYFDRLDYNFAKLNQLKELDSACATIRNGNLLGRNYDSLYNNDIEFVVKTTRNSGRYATIGIASSIALDGERLDRQFIESNRYSELYRLIPFAIVDGINEYGLSVSVNTISSTTITATEYTPADKSLETIHASMLARYIIDNFKDIDEALLFIQNHLTIQSAHQGQQLIVADSDRTVLITLGDTLSITDLITKPYVTNFKVNGVIFNEDGKVYTPENQTELENAAISNMLSAFSKGLERYNIIVDNYENTKTKDDMLNLLSMLNYSNTYKNETTPFWYSEYVGVPVTEGATNYLTVTSEPINFESRVSTWGQIFRNRSRLSTSSMYGTSHTTHTSLYDLNDKTITVIVQENDETRSEYNFDFMPLIAINPELLTQDKTIIGAINEIYTLLQNK